MIPENFGSSNASPFSLVKMAQQLISGLDRDARKKEIRLTLDCDVNPELMTIADSVSLQEILIGILKDTISHTEKSIVLFKIKILEVFEESARFYFEVKNSGIILKKDLAANQTQLLQYQELVQQLGGEIESEHKEALGSRYSVTLDLKINPLAEKEISKKKTRLTSDKPLLVVEDQDINQVVIRKYLEILGLSCHVVIDGHSAFIEATSGKYCLVLMDCKMQPVSGYEATQLIRYYEKKSGTRIPIVALTADGSAEDRLRCEQVGMDDYVVKPIDLDTLESVLSKWIGPALKEEYIKKLKGHFLEGRPLFHVLADDFYVSAPALISNLEKSIENKELKKVQFYSHSLKSSSLTLGLVELGALCEKLEYLKELTPLTLNDVTQIKDAFKKGEAALKSRIAAELANS